MKTLIGLLAALLAGTVLACNNEQPPYRIAPDFVERVDGVVQQALKHKLAIVLDMHHCANMMLEPAAERERFLAIWRQVVEHDRDAPPTVLF